MATVRNESVARVAMVLCFGTAILSLAVHWRISTSITSVVSSETYGGALARAADIPNKPRNLVQNENEAQKSHTSNPLKSLLAQVSNPQKSPLFLASANQTQVVVDLSDRRVYVYRSDQVIASYPTGVGKKGWETPTGKFQVDHMQRNPIWRHPITGKVFPSGVDSPLGDRWIGFWSDGRNKIGFHGTPDDELVGTAVSHGCLRMRTPDVRMLYKQVSLGTTVEVRE